MDCSDDKKMEHSIANEFWFNVIYIFIIVSQTLECHAEPDTLILSENVSHYNSIKSHTKVYEDVSRKINFSDITSLEAKDWVNAGEMSFGVSDNIFWFKISIDNQSTRTNWYLVDRLGTHDHFSVFQYNHYGTLSKTDWGIFDKKKRPIDHRHLVIPVELELGLNIFYLRVSSETPIVPLFALYDETALLKNTYEENLLLGAYYGAVLAMILYNLFIYLSLREGAYLWYCVYVFSYALTGFYLQGFHFQYFGEGFTANHLGLELDKPGGPLAIIFAATTIGMINFTRSFLHTANYYPAIDRILRYSVYLTLLLAAPILLVRDNELFVIVKGYQNILVVMFIVLGAVVAISRKMISAWYFVTAWVFLAAGMTVFSFTMTGILPANFFTIYAGFFLSAVEMSLLSLALAARIQALQQDAMTLKEKNHQQLEQSVAALTTAREEADRSNLEKTKFLAMISHELQTPIDSLIGPLKILNDSNIGAMQKRIISSALDSTKSITSLINDAIMFAKLETNQFKIKKEKVDITELCRSVVQLYETRAVNKGLKISLREQVSRETFAYTDGVRIRQILSNLLSNAIKYTQQGDVTVLLYLHKEGGILDTTFQVRDSGIGIADDDMTTIFEAFRQIDNPYRGDGGTGMGLGLTISSQLARALDGHITVHSKLGKGSTFTFQMNAQVYDKQERVNSKYEKDNINQVAEIVTLNHFRNRE